jgi:hypothetical protein
MRLVLIMIQLMDFKMQNYYKNQPLYSFEHCTLKN